MTDDYDDIIKSIASQYEDSMKHHSAVDLDDLIQEGRLKLLLLKRPLPVGNEKAYIGKVIRNCYNKIYNKEQAEYAISLDEKPEYIPVVIMSTNTLELTLLDLIKTGYACHEICDMLDISYYRYCKLIDGVKKKILV